MAELETSGPRRRRGMRAALLVSAATLGIGLMLLRVHRRRSILAPGRLLEHHHAAGLQQG